MVAAIAEHLHPHRLEVVNADSRQVYKGLNIGTAKPPVSLLAAVPHHLLDIIEPSEDFSAADFVRRAGVAVEQIRARGSVPLVVGGAMFYVRTMLYGVPETPPSDPAVREALVVRVERDGLPAIHAELATVDADTARRLHVNDRSRILRAMEVYQLSGRPLSTFRSTSHSAQPEVCVFAARRERSELYARVELRVEQMMAEGLAEEVAQLVASGFGPDAPGMGSIGYAEFFDADGGLRGGDALGQVVALTKRNTRRFAKRQMTFAMRLPVSVWIDLDIDDLAGWDSPTAAAAAIAEVLVGAS